jgi:hypothetical protein
LVFITIVQAAAGIVRAESEGAGHAHTYLSLEDVRKRIQEKGYAWTAGRTSLSELSPEELAGRMGTLIPDNYDDTLSGIRGRSPVLPAFDLPSRFDWSDSIGMPPIREQLCGDCWAQAVTAAMECQLRIQDLDTTSLAVQHVIDCNLGQSNCAGGFLWDACFLFEHVGAVAEDCDPYVGADLNCTSDTCPIIGRLDGFEDIDTTVVSIKTHLMEYGPIPVALGVPPDLQYYTGGCYESDLAWEWWHAMLIIGWEDTMCGGQGAWHCWNCSGTEWGEDGYAWIKYGTADIGADAKILHYISKGAVQPALASFTLDDSSGDADSVADPGESVVLAMGLSNSGWLTATGVTAVLTTLTPGITVTTSSAAFPDIEPDSTGWSVSPHFSFSVSGDMLCGRTAEFLVSISSNEGVAVDDFEIIVGEAGTVLFDDAEIDLGWSLSAPDDDATYGVWRRRNPIGTATDSSIVQPERDHTPAGGVRCFVTSNVPRGLSPGSGDVDGGKTTLTSPVIDLSDRAFAACRCWRWYTNDAGGIGDDIWTVDVSADSGATWVNLETEASSEAAWVRQEFELNTAIALTDKVLVRFVASDYGVDSIVEAAVDDFEIIASPYWVDLLGPAVTVLSPNGGEELTEQTQFDIRWSAGDDYGLRGMTVLASYDGGVSFTDTLGTKIWPDTTLLWDVPAGEHPECMVRVEVVDRGYNTAADESDSVFAVVPDLSGVHGEGTSAGVLAVELLGSERNPFTGKTHIFYIVPQAAYARLAVYDVKGRRIRDLVSGRVEGGYHSVLWDGRTDSGRPAAPGVYFVHLSASGAHHTAKVVLER